MTRRYCAIFHFSLASI